MMVDFGDDVIDSRDVIERIEELETLGMNDIDQDHEAAIEAGDYDADDLAEWKAWKALSDEASQYAEDWQYGEALILDSYWEDYARQLAEDTAPTHEIAELIKNDGRGDYWPLTCAVIDWERAARDLQMDYTSVDVTYDGQTYTYWTR